MARLPQPGSDQGTWGDVLNEFLSVSHASNGVLRSGVVSEQQLDAAAQAKLNQVAGPQGIPGPVGPAGPVNALTIGVVSSGVVADATLTGTAPSQILNLVLPQGDPGQAGVNGLDGAQGIQGVPGTNGVAGPANSLAIGTVTDGVVASATITGAAPSQTLNLTLVKGDKGDDGPQGIPGLQGAPGVNGLDGAQGIQGIPGQDGADGAAGAPGTTSWAGITDKPIIPTIIASITPPLSPAVGDMWVDLSS